MSFTGGLPSLLTSNTAKRADIHINEIKSDSGIEIKEVSVGNLPETNHLQIYTKNDSLLYTKNDLGVENRLAIISEISEELGTGILNGGDLSINGDTTKFNIVDGNGKIYNSSSGLLTDISWSGLTEQFPPLGYVTIETFVSIDINGLPVYQTTTLTNSEKRDQIFLGILVSLDSVNLFLVTTEPNPLYNISLQLEDFMHAVGILNLGPNTVSAPSTNLTVAKSAGSIVDHSANYSININDPHIVQLGPLNTNISDTFAYVMQNLENTQGNTVLIPDRYDNNTGFPGGLVGNNKWTTQRIAIGAANLLQILPGQFVYNSLCESQDSISTEGFVTLQALTDELVIIGYITLKGNAVNLQDPGDASILQAAKFTGQAISSVPSAGGSPNEIQFNDPLTGALSGDPLLTWDKATSKMAVNTLVIDSIGNIAKDGDLFLTARGGVNDNLALGNVTDHLDSYFAGGSIWVKQNTPTDYGNTSPSVTTQELKTFILLGNPLINRTYILPDADVLINTDLNNPEVDDSLDFCVINQNATNTIDLVGEATEIGSMDILPSTSGLFRIRLTNITPASESYEVYRIS